MQRVRTQPRTDWQRTVESQGLTYHTLDGQPYWDESAYYLLSSSEVDWIEKATYALDEMCLTAVEYVVKERLFDRFGIPPEFIPFLTDSWERDEFTLYGRFDLAFDGTHPPKLLEFNADTPTALLEAAAVQWFWFKDVHPRLDQFNNIHERLIEAWKSFREYLTQPVYFASAADSAEDFSTVTYLRDTAIQAGLTTEYLEVEQMGWDQARRCFVDMADQPIQTAFKLYPWEWLLRERFGPHLLECQMTWLEAPWKMLLSNKAILAVLWELFPESPYLLETSLEPLGSTFVRKPRLGREGANITVVENGRTVLTTDGDYPGPYVFQHRWPLRSFEGRYPVIGSWLVNGYACGIGIREDETPITRNTSRFVPHAFKH